jgi:hypothetical protein
LPRSFIVAGSRTARTRVASIRIAAARLHPIAQGLSNAEKHRPENRLRSRHLESGDLH